MLQAAEAALAKPGSAAEAHQGAADDGGGGGGGEDGEGAAAAGAEIEIGAEIEMTLSQADRQEGAARLPAMRRRLQATGQPSPNPSH